MDTLPPEMDVESILARFDRSSPDLLLRSIAAEIASLCQANRSILARMHALELAQTYNDQMATDSQGLQWATMPRETVVEAAFSLPIESGFYPIEYTDAGTPFRWTGPGASFFFEVFVNREAPARLRMHHGRIFAKDAKNKVRCYVDGKEIDTSSIDVKGGFEIHALLPARRVVGGTVITFICPGVASPSKEGSQDNRRLGLVFYWLRIDPANAASLEPATKNEDLGAIKVTTSMQSLGQATPSQPIADTVTPAT